MLLEAILIEVLMMKRNGDWVALGALGLAMTWGCGDGASDDGTLVASLQPTGTAALMQTLVTTVEQGDSPGVVGLVVSRDGVLFEGAAGQLDVANGTAMPADAIFNIASMTKPVTSVAAMMLVERGMLGLDDPVSMYLPELAAPEVLTSFDLASGEYEAAPARNVMTIRHLLSHTSGIGYAFANTTVQRLLEDSPGPEWAIPLLCEPGTEWHYSASTRAVGLIIEQLTGQSLEDFFQQQIFEPLGMNDTSYAVPADKLGRLPTLHSRGGDGTLNESAQMGVPTVPTAPFGGDGGLYSTARDYGSFMRMLLNGGALGDARILSEASVAQMGANQIGDIFVELQDAAIPTLTRPFPLGAGRDKFGLGFQLTGPATGDAPSRSPGSMAWAGLFNTEFWIDPTRQIAATLLMQVLPFYDEGAIRALQDFEATVYRGLAPPAGD